MPLYLYLPRSPARLQRSIPPCLHTARIASLQNCIPLSPRPYACCTSPGLHASISTSLYLHVTTPAARLQGSMPPYLPAFQAVLSTPYLHTSLSPRRYTAPPNFQSSMPPCFHGLYAC